MGASETYEHTDLVLAATLITCVHLEGEMSRRGNQVVWTYRRTETLETMLEKFHAGNCLVEPLSFAKILRQTRNRVYSLMDYNPPSVQAAARTPTS